MQKLLLVLIFMSSFVCTVGFIEPAVSDTYSRETISPYIQNITSNSAVVMWQTSKPASARLIVSNQKQSFEYKISKSRTLNEIYLKGLSPGTEYKYQLHLTDNNVIKSGSFRTFTVSDEQIRFIAYGDSRSRPDRHRQVIKAMSREKDIAFVLHTGDLVANGRNLNQWTSDFFQPAAPMLAKVPFYPVLGNHEGGSSYYFKYFNLPGNERWYSFDASNVHIIALDSNSSFNNGSAQYKWLVNDLEKHKNAKWKLIFMHHPTYTSGEHGDKRNGVPVEQPIRTAQKLFPSLAKKYGIKLIFAGHDHAYERSVNGGVTYIVTGGAGAPNYGQPNAKHNPYRKVFYSGLHYCVVTVDGNKASVIAKKPDGSVIDRVDL